MAKIVGKTQRVARCIYATFDVVEHRSAAALYPFRHDPGDWLPCNGPVTESLDHTHRNTRYNDLPLYGNGGSNFVIQSIEATVLLGTNEPALQPILRALRLELIIGSQVQFSAWLNQICIGDSVLYARVEALEKTLASLLQLQSGETPEQRLREGLVRLGWKPKSFVDHRRLTPPLLLDETTAWDVSVDVPSKLKILDRIRIRVSLHGLASIAII